MKVISTQNAPAAIGPYSQAIINAGMVYTSGQIPIDPVTNTVVEGDITVQAEQVMKNLEAILTAAGSSLTSTVKTTCFIKDMNDFAAFNAIYANYFTGNPARSCVEVSKLPKGVLVEVEATAIID